MSSTSLACWYGLNYGNSKYIHEFDDIAQARTDFANNFTNWLAIKQPTINAYYETLFDKINNYLDEMTFTKEGQTTLEKHKGRKMSTNTDFKESFNEDTKRAQKTDLKEKQSTDTTDKISFGKTTEENAIYTDTHSRSYFGSTQLIDNEKTEHSGTSGNNSTQEGGTQKLQRTGTADSNVKSTIGTDTDNYIKTTRNELQNFNHKVGTALENYTTIQDISAEIFDNDVMDYNNYIETTHNSWHTVQVAYDLLNKLNSKTFIEQLLIEFFNYISYCVE